MAEPGPRYTAGEVPGLRHDLADWYGGTQGAQFYYNAILVGQQLKPPGPPERVARRWQPPRPPNSATATSGTSTRTCAPCSTPHTPSMPRGPPPRARDS